MKTISVNTFDLYRNYIKENQKEPNAKYKPNRSAVIKNKRRRAKK